MSATETMEQQIEALIERSNRLATAARHIQEHEPSSASDSDLEQLHLQYLGWYAESLSLMPEDLHKKFEREYEGAGPTWGQKIHRFFTDPRKRHSLWNGEPHDPNNPFSPTFFQFPVDRYFVHPLRQQQGLLMQVQKRCTATSKGSAARTGAAPVNTVGGAPGNLAVFIGHGHSSIYKHVETFLEKRLGLEPLTFESGPRVGMTNVDVLKTCLNRARFAILVLTPEDEEVGGKRARQNVVHEIGLFQGRLGFERVALLRQSGVEEFSNLEGLQELRFTQDNIRVVFEDLRAVLEREGLTKLS